MLTAAYQFQLAGVPVSCERYGGGHINETYLLETDQRKYILQKINRRVFRDVPSLMRNIALVAQHLRQLEPDPRRVLTIIPAADGMDYLKDDDGECWRVYDFINGSLCLEKAQSAGDMYQTGVAFGRFQSMLSGFPADTLFETIEGFHDTPGRFAQLREAVLKNAAGRLHFAKAEIDFALQRENEAGAMVHMLREGKLPLRVTHNDAKLNNVMLDAKTGEALCVVDLDTVMPGLAGNDFGDSIRFGASTALEDEKDLDKVSLSLDFYHSYAKGFLGACGANLSRAEVDTLPMGAKLMTLECGVRFLTDYLSGDKYFRIRRPEHNLDRCRTQFRLVFDMESKWDAMGEIIQMVARRDVQP
jgi:Ser/Thr protein kinase RdoA (MazF antagonist)